jgi:flagellar motor switch protein FliN
MAETSDAAVDPQAQTQAPAVEVGQVEIPEVAEMSVQVPPGQIDILLETAMPVQACLGAVEIQVKDLLQLGPNSVVKLNQQVGEPIDLHLCGVRFATGHLVVVGDQLGVRIKEVLSRDQLAKAAAGRH